MIRKLAIATILGGAITVAQADVYRVVDAQGHVQYTDRWSPGATLVKVDKNHPKPETASPPSDSGRLAGSNDRISAQIAEQNATKAMQQDVAKTREEQCKQAKERYEQSIRARRIYRQSKDGKKEFVSDAEADAYRLQARTDMEAACKK